MRGERKEKMTEHEKRVEYLLFNIFNYFTELHQLPYITDENDRERTKRNLQDIFDSVCNLEQDFRRELFEESVSEEY